MTTKPTAQIDPTAALRHFVYRDLLAMLPIASYRQVQRFAANLALCRMCLLPRLIPPSDKAAAEDDRRELDRLKRGR